MKIGYSYWGYLADEKLDENGNRVSTPDGNAFYSWSIIYELLTRGNEVYQLMPNRDRHAEKYIGVDKMFSKFCMQQRRYAYNVMHKDIYNGLEESDWNSITIDMLKQMWLDYGVNKFDAILHEWRMLIPGRNDINNPGCQPDYIIQRALIDFCTEHNILLIVFDLDYKLTEGQYRDLRKQVKKLRVLELGYKWNRMNYSDCYHVEIPFDSFELRRGFKGTLREDGFDTDIVYIGNRYERDECIDRYIPNDENVSTTFYGNWLQPAYNDCLEKWPFIKYGERLQAADIPDVYDKSICTILFAKEEYYKNAFMTARILETVYYGCLPLFPINYGVNIIDKYAGKASELLTVVDSKDVAKTVKHFKNNVAKRNELIDYLRQRLSFMDVKYIVNSILCICKSNNM